MTLEEVRQAIKDSPCYIHDDRKIAIFRPCPEGAAFAEIDQDLLLAALRQIQTTSTLIRAGICEKGDRPAEAVLMVLLVNHAKNMGYE